LFSFVPQNELSHVFIVSLTPLFVNVFMNFFDLFFRTYKLNLNISKQIIIICKISKKYQKAQKKAEPTSCSGPAFSLYFLPVSIPSEISI